MIGSVPWILLHFVVVGGPMTWAATGVIILAYQKRGQPAPGYSWTLYFELRPFYLPMVACDVIQTIGKHPGDMLGWPNLIVLGLQLFCWFGYRDMDDDDDDRWKRRRRKLTEKVSRVGARLVAVPAGAR